MRGIKDKVAEGEGGQETGREGQYFRQVSCLGRGGGKGGVERGRRRRIEGVERGRMGRVEIRQPRAAEHGLPVAHAATPLRRTACAPKEKTHPSRPSLLPGNLYCHDTVVFLFLFALAHALP